MTKDCKPLAITQDCHAQQVALAMTGKIVILSVSEVFQKHEIATNPLARILAMAALFVGLKALAEEYLFLSY